MHLNFEGLHARLEDDLEPSLALRAALWKRDGASFPTDDARAFSLTVVGAIFQPGRGRLFDGSDDVIRMAHDPRMNLVDDLTLEVWLKLTTLVAGRTFISKRDGTNSNFYFGVHATDVTKLEFYYYDASGAQYWSSAAHLLKAGDQSHIGVVKRVGYAPVFYVNGRVLAATRISGAGAGAPVVSAGPVSIGAFDNGSLVSNTISGVISEARIYAEALTPTHMMRHSYEGKLLQP